jgi:hypothetical protein
MVVLPFGLQQLLRRNQFTHHRKFFLPNES